MCLKVSPLTLVQFNPASLMVAAQILNRVAPASAASAAQNEWADRPFNDVICLFDVDGTLSLSRKVQD